MARCLMHEKKMPLKFWAEAVNTASYIQNRVTSRVLDDKTPYEIWYDVKPNVEHLRVFGCICYVLIHDANRKKLDKKADIGVLIGYSSKSKAYRIFDVIANKVTIARNVKFVEDASWNWESLAVN